MSLFPGEGRSLSRRPCGSVSASRREASSWSGTGTGGWGSRRRGLWEAVTNAYCVAEARLNLERKYPDSLGRLEKILDTVRLVPDVPGELCPIRLPEKDRPGFPPAHP